MICSKKILLIIIVIVLGSCAKPVMKAKGWYNVVYTMKCGEKGEVIGKDPIFKNDKLYIRSNYGWKWRYCFVGCERSHKGHNHGPVVAVDILTRK